MSLFATSGERPLGLRLRNPGYETLSHFTATRSRTNLSCSEVSIAPGRTARTLAIASAGFVPSSTRSRAAIIPARPSPPRQWTSTSRPPRRSARTCLPALSHLSSNLWSGIDASTMGRLNRDILFGADFFAETFHFQQRELLGLHKRDDRSRSPVANRVEIDREIAFPRAGHRMTVAFAWTEIKCHQSEAGSGSYGGDLQRVAQGWLLFNSQIQLAATARQRSAERKPWSFRFVARMSSSRHPGNIPTLVGPARQPLLCIQRMQICRDVVEPGPAAFVARMSSCDIRNAPGLRACRGYAPAMTSDAGRIFLTADLIPPSTCRAP